MNTLLVYPVKSAFCLAGFYLVYYLFLSRDTLYGRNRIFLLLSVILSFILPLFTFNVKESSSIAYFGKTLSEIFVTAQKESSGSETLKAVSDGLRENIFIIYLTGVSLFVLKLLADLIILIYLIRRSRVNGSRVIRFHRFNSPGFSALGYVFINNSLSPEDAEEIIRHERKHLEHSHFLDIMLIETAKAVQWFNPVIYLINRSLRAVHEYQADKECLNSGIDVTGYRNLLMNTILNTRIFVTSNSFSNPSLIRKRMLMMTREKSPAISTLKAIIAIPVALIMLFMISACEKKARNLNQNAGAFPAETPQLNVGREEVTPPPTPPVDNVSGNVINETVKEEQAPKEVYTVVEEMPQYPGGAKALMEFIYSNIKYPEKAKQENIQGRVILRFCINYKGGVEQVTVIKGVDPLLDNEAVRVIKMLPQWQPGKQGGKPVNVWYSVPVNFALTDKGD